MHSFLTSFTSMYNHRHSSCGHVYQGRYKAFVVQDSKAYIGKVTQYIHLNPACIPSVSDKTPEERHEIALRDPWSSYAAVMGVRRRPSWLHRDAVLKGWGGNLGEKRQAYGEALRMRLLGDVIDPMEEAAARAVLGGERFIDRLRRGLNDLGENLEIRRGSAQHRQLSSWIPLESVVAAVRTAYGCRTEQLLRRHNRNFEARQVLLYLAATHCRGRCSLTELGQKLGPVSLAAVSNARSKMARRMADDPQLQSRVEKIASEFCS
jgi:hypothetical protein